MMDDTPELPLRALLRQFDLDWRAMGAISIIESPLCTISELDLSGCRSPSRAKRRHKRGIVGRTRMVSKPTAILVKEDGQRQVLYAHPDFIKALETKVSTKYNQGVDNAYFREQAAEFARAGNPEAFRRQYTQRWNYDTDETLLTKAIRNHDPDYTNVAWLDEERERKKRGGIKIETHTGTGTGPKTI